MTLDMSRARALGLAAATALGLAVALAACHRQPSCDPKERVKLDFTLKDLNGRDVNLASYRGKPLLINFWATWCGPCKEEIPALIELAGKYGSARQTDWWDRLLGRGGGAIAIFGISVDDKPEDLQKFAAANKVNYPLLVGLGHDDLLEAFDAEVAVPISWFVAADGCPAARHQGGAAKDWFEQQMKALL